MIHHRLDGLTSVDKGNNLSAHRLEEPGQHLSDKSVILEYSHATDRQGRVWAGVIVTVHIHHIVECFHSHLRE